MTYAKAITRTFFKDNSGFSLIELLISLVIVSIVSVAVYGVFSLASRSYTTQSVSADVGNKFIIGTNSNFNVTAIGHRLHRID